MNKLIGSDIEYALKNRATGVFEPAGILPIRGRKGRPQKLSTGGVEIDCCGVEITPNAAATEVDWLHNITVLKAEVENRFPDYSLICQPAVRFAPHVLNSVRFANTMGCSRDFNAWTSAQNPSPTPHDAQGLRTFGGHIHIEEGSPLTILVCDVILGLWSLIMDNSERRQLYGRAGAFRPKPYGVEYRVLSNFWCESTSLMSYIYRSVNFARSIAKDEFLSRMERSPIEVSDVAHLINEGASFTTTDYEKVLGSVFPECLSDYTECMHAAA